jgi:hypothetical protein
MLMPERLESHLEQNHIAFSLISHRPTRSAHVAAPLMHLPGKKVRGKGAIVNNGSVTDLVGMPGPITSRPGSYPRFHRVGQG